jgi:hypothetical protein
MKKSARGLLASFQLSIPGANVARNLNGGVSAAAGRHPCVGGDCWLQRRIRILYGLILV